MGILSTKRSKAIAGGIGGVAIAGGAAFAAILLSTTITGSAAIDTTTTANSIAVSGTNEGRLDCSNTSITPDFKTLTVSAVLKRTAGGPNSNAVAQGDASCVITTAIKNTGDTALTPGAPDFHVPDGWTVGLAPGGTVPPASIAPGATYEAKVLLTATPAAVAGPITGSLTFSD